MTDQINLGLTWAKDGGVTPVTVNKYEGGWVAEIPTYQNFNYMVQGLDKNILHLAEASSYDWQDDINYKVGSKVLSNGTLMTCVQDNLNQDPTTDGTGSYWVQGTHFGEAPSDLTKADGLLVEFTPRTGNLYNGQDQTVVNNIPLVVLETTGTAKNWALGNVGGEVTVSDLGNSGAPDTRDLSKDQGNTHRVFHEGHLPTVGEVVGGVEEAPTNGKLYARKGLTATSGEWVTVTATDVTNEPPPPVTGAGQGWYNLADGRFYIDINDGDSSQWVPANPPMVPVSAASNVTYDDTVNDLGSTVQEAISTLHDTALNTNLLINGNFDIWQRGTSFTTPNAWYSADRWISTHTLSSGSITTTKNDFVAGQSVTGDSTNYLKITGTSATSNNNTGVILAQFVEGVETLEGKTATLSFWAKTSNVLGRKLGVEVYQSFGLGASASPYNTTMAEQTDITNTWTQYTFTFDVDSISGKTIDGADSRLSLNIFAAAKGTAASDKGWTEIPDLGSDSVSIAQVKLEEGPVFTGWPHVDPATELVKCQRYYETGYEHHRFQMPHTVVTFTAMVDFKTSKRALPSVSLTTARNLGPETSNAITLYDMSASTYSVDTSFNISDGTSNEGFLFYKNDIYDTNDFTSFFWIADSEL